MMADENQYHVLDEDRKPVPATKAEWEKFTREDVIVAKMEFPNGGTVTTRFRGFGDKASEYFMSEYDPDDVLLFETYSRFGSDVNQEDEYPSWAQAEEGHNEIVARYEKLFS